MEKRHVQTFLMVSAAFFAMSMPVHQVRAGEMTQAVSRTLAKAGIGAGPAERWAASMGEAPARRTAIAKASRKHISAVELASAKHGDTLDEASVETFPSL